MPIIHTNSGDISYDVQGDGPPLVLLRGLGRTVRHWLGYDKVLARDFKVITLDLRGIGASKVPCTWTTSVFDMAEDIVAVLDHLGLADAHIMGVSLGGMVTLAMGLAAPGRCRSLIVVNTSIAGQGTLRITPKALRTLATGAMNRDDRFHHRLVDALVGPDCPAERRAEVAKQYADLAAEEGLFIDVVLKQLCAAGRFFAARRLRSLTVPTLVVYGTGDQFVPTVNSRKLVSHLPDAKLVPIRGGGHELSLDKPDELARVVRDWVSENETRSPRPAASARTRPEIPGSTSRRTS